MEPVIWLPAAATAPSEFVHVPDSDEPTERFPEVLAKIAVWVEPPKVMLHMVGSGIPVFPEFVSRSEHCSSGPEI